MNGDADGENNFEAGRRCYGGGFGVVDGEVTAVVVLVVAEAPGGEGCCVGGDSGGGSGDGGADSGRGGGGVGGGCSGGDGDGGVGSGGGGSRGGGHKYDYSER